LGTYDSPGFQNQLPGFAPRCSHDYMTAAGSAGTNPGETNGPVVGTPVVSPVYVSSQVPEGQPVKAVTAGDTSSFSDDNPVHYSALLGGGRVGNSPDETGAGRGRAGHNRHPNNNGG